MEYLPELLTVAAATLMTMMSPGPDFVLVSRNSLAYSRRAGILAALGISLGIVVHVTYSLVGIGLLISRSAIIFSILKFAGAAYLVYIGYRSLHAKPQKTLSTTATSPETMPQRQMSDAAAFRTGFITNVLNPKVTLFFLALFTQVIDPGTPKPAQMAYGAGIFLMNVTWWSFIAILLSHRSVKGKFIRLQHHFERVFGAVLIALGIRVALSSSK